MPRYDLSPEPVKLELENLINGYKSLFKSDHNRDFVKMHDFKFKNGELYCEDVKVKDVAAKVGTPFYLYSHHTLVDHFTKIQKAFAPVEPLICFAMKSNDNLAVLKTLSNLGAGFDIVSGGELKKHFVPAFPPARLFSPPLAKPRKKITDAINAGILFI